MKFLYSKKFKQLYKILPVAIRRKFDKQICLLASNIHHPSLHAKKIQGRTNIWEARVDYRYRFTFIWEGEAVVLRTIGAHDEALNNP